MTVRKKGDKHVHRISVSLNDTEFETVEDFVNFIGDVRAVVLRELILWAISQKRSLPANQLISHFNRRSSDLRH